MIKKISKINRKEYEKLKLRYNKLKDKYNKIKSRKINLVFAIITYLIGIVGIIVYRHPTIIEVGVLLLFIGLIIELNGTKKSKWEYADSLYMISGRVPIEIVLQYFFIGTVSASYYLFRTQTLVGFII